MFGFEKLKFFSRIIILSLIILICILSSLDASEFARCSHIGLCEFLEIQVVLGSSQKIKSINYVFDMLNDSINGFHNFPELKNFTYHMNYIQEHNFPSIPHWLNRFIKPYHESLGSPFRRIYKISVTRQEKSQLLREFGIYSQILEMIKNSVMQS
jgi:hypothetical protein